MTRSVIFDITDSKEIGRKFLAMVTSPAVEAAQLAQFSTSRETSQ